MKKKTSKTKNNFYLKLEELSWKQIEELNPDKTVFFLPISPLEEHGPHLPVGTDFLTSIDTVSEAVKILKEKKPDFTYVMIPSVPIGYCKFVKDFPGSISVSSKVVRDVVYSIGDSLARHGFKYLIICTYHMALGHLKGIYSAMNKLKKKYDMKVSEPWGPFYYNNMIEKREPKMDFDTSKDNHAGFRETSLMKYQYPYLVDDSYKKLQNVYRDLNSPKTIGKTFKQLGLKEGYVGNPANADLDYGRWFFTETVNVYVGATIAITEGKKLPDLPKNVKKTMKALFWQ